MVRFQIIDTLRRYSTNTHSFRIRYKIYCTSMLLTHWGRVTHICVGNLTIIGSNNGLSAGRRQAIIWTNAGILLIGPWGTQKFNRYSNIFIQQNAFENVVCEMASILSRPQCVKPQICWHSTDILLIVSSESDTQILLSPGIIHTVI